MCSIIVHAGAVDSKKLSTCFIGNSLVFKRFRTKFTLVVRSKCFFRIFFSTNHLHGELANLFFAYSAFSLRSKAGFSFKLSSLESSKTTDALSRNSFFPVAKKIRLNVIFAGNCI